eukprot:TRINITY_DN1452_c0_g1_i11.p1 TRINITY_DN1452_c0_g1~~TRINITY_DN1452_c0_g1_i11.p1  ORF type:complete len:401 (-),score=23.62 TRINITY_DN1452_c0_g1_i11:493-1695(-)
MFCKILSLAMSLTFFFYIKFIQCQNSYGVSYINTYTPFNPQQSDEYPQGILAIAPIDQDDTQPAIVDRQDFLNSFSYQPQQQNGFSNFQFTNQGIQSSTLNFGSPTINPTPRVSPSISVINSPSANTSVPSTSSIQAIFQPPQNTQDDVDLELEEFTAKQVTPSNGTRDCLLHFLIWPDGYNGTQITHCFPLSAIGRLEMFFENGVQTYCTGAVIGPRLVLTAAHCFRPSILKLMVTNVIFTPGQFGSFKPFGSFSNGIAHVPDSFQKPNDITDDYAVVEFPVDLGEQTGWFGIDYRKCKTENNQIVYNLKTAGYSDKKGVDEMWTSECLNTVVDSCQQGDKAGQFLHECDTFHGYSGSPMYQDNLIVGIHVSYDKNQIKNSAVYISKQLIEFVSKYVRQ